MWDAVLGRLPDRWVEMAAPAVVFWTGAIATWASASPGWSRLGDMASWLNEQSTASQIAAAIGAFTVVAASVIVVNGVTPRVYRLLEGYWPSFLQIFADFSRRKIERRRSADEKAWQELQTHIELQHGQPTAQQHARLSRLERRRRHQPVLTSELLPTRVGNILRAAEARPRHRYGLDAIIAWPRMWLVMPESARQELIAARAALDASVSAVIWGLGFMVFAFWSWWAAPLGIMVAGVAVTLSVPARAETFSDLLEASFDLYRATLYRNLRWPLPKNPSEERKSGSELTQYLFRGSDSPQPKFDPPLTEE